MQLLPQRLHLYLIEFQWIGEARCLRMSTSMCNMQYAVFRTALAGYLEACCYSWRSHPNSLNTFKSGLQNPPLCSLCMCIYGRSNQIKAVITVVAGVLQWEVYSLLALMEPCCPCMCMFMQFLHMKLLSQWWQDLQCRSTPLEGPLSAAADGGATMRGLKYWYGTLLLVLSARSFLLHVAF